jgi:hypothetical protein
MSSYQFLTEFLTTERLAANKQHDDSDTSQLQQFDWRWAICYRAIVRYDAYQWLTPAAFSPSEAEKWIQLQEQEPSEECQRHKEKLMVQSRDREILAALSEEREPHFHYPCIPLGEVEYKLQALQMLARDIAQNEQNVVVRRLYLDVIDEHTLLLQMVKATYEGDTRTYLHTNQAMYPAPTRNEMERALWHVAKFIAQGRQRTDLREVSEEVFQFLQHIQAPLPSVSPLLPPLQKNSPLLSTNQRVVSAKTIQRFFNAVMHDYGFDNWQAIINESATVARIEQLTQCVILPDQSRSLAGVRDMLSHEVESHVFRAASGTKSRLDLLGTGTAFFMATEEGLAKYNDRKIAELQGQNLEEFSPGSLICTIATGLASGVVTTPLTFSQLYHFLERFFFLQRVIAGISKNVEKAHANAPRLARLRCLRTFMGVPDLTIAGIAYTKDALYYRGEQIVTAAIQRDPQVLTRLMVGVVGLQQLDDLAELGITEPPSYPRWLAHDPDLDNYILSFEMEGE